MTYDPRYPRKTSVKDIQCYSLDTHFPKKPTFVGNKAVYTSQSRVRVGRGSDEIDQLDSLAGAVTPKPPVNAEKS